MSLLSYFPRLIIIVLLVAYLPQAIAEPGSAVAYARHAASIYPDLVKIRRDLYAKPEASGHEKVTSKLVADYLTELGLEVKTNIGGYGVVGILKGNKPGKRIVWRADMDAAKFVMGEHSHQDLAHVCGHDVNTTIGLGIANTLSQDLENLPGTVYFIFQPAEEDQKGAKAMIADGLLEMMDADEVYASHIGPSETGVISTQPGNLFSHSRYIDIKFDTDSRSEALVDSVQSIMNSLTRIKSPELFFNLLNTLNTEHGIGNPETIYQDYILFGGRPLVTSIEDHTVLKTELFTADYDDINMTVNALKQQIQSSPVKDRFVSINVRHEREGVNNDANLVAQTSQFLNQTFGEDATEAYYGKVPFASEDFGHFQKRIPGVYFFIGASNEEKGIVSFPHMPNFDVDEKVIQHGVTRFSGLILSRLGS